MPEPEVLRPRTQDRWSVKDVLAHLLGCDEETTRRFRLIARRRADRIHWFESMADHFRRLSPRSLDDPSHVYTVVDWLPAPGWEHEREHMSEVRAWWRRRRRVL
jgi:hypothetical protein